MMTETEMETLDKGKLQFTNPAFTPEGEGEGEGGQPPATIDASQSKADLAGGMPEQPAGPEQIPSLTYVDFMPRCLGVPMEGCSPEYADYRSVVEQANQWLESMQQYVVWQCQTTRRKLPTDLKLDLDCSTYHESSQGKNTYVYGLRLWLRPRGEEDGKAVQQLAYITVLPDSPETSYMDSMERVAMNSSFRLSSDTEVPTFEGTAATMDKLNRQLKARPLPGKIITIDTVTFKVKESGQVAPLNVENCCHTETGKNSRLYIHALRIFYVVGAPVFEEIGLHEEIPNIYQNDEGVSLRIKFAPFRNVVAKASKWLEKQEGIRIINMQTVNVKCEKTPGGQILVDNKASGYSIMGFLQSSQFVKMLRIMYSRDTKMTTPLYSSVEMTSRLFVPTRSKVNYRVFETFSKLMQRIIVWLQLTKLQPLGVEAVEYPLAIESYGPGVQEERTDQLISQHIGRYYITCIRLYFSGPFEEPPPELLPKTEEDEEAGWMCVVS